ncbi:MAG: hypothetical protein P0Y50_14690 [Candidatus Brevundimonas colombiensis]|uniref:Uncharacterized protein n=1 Tax=Candidatus Brevundimonas colombiensis TaxID=3121376 RepID=A0AAJ5X073_9CAUL|nr:hypothetical protein [Brevundimonas sp.]WEK39762.1 MAG: hypothetical protein P0Y50_14690 [Brevundimonas sp.]
MTLIALAAAVALSGQAAPPPRAGSDLTRDLNSAPPSAASAAPRATPSSTTPAATPSSSPSSRATTSAPTRAQTAAPQTPAPQTSAPQTTNPARSSPAAPAARPTTTQPSAPAQTAPAASTPAPAPTPSPAALDAAGIAALPFRIELPAGVVMVPARAGADAAIYRIQRGDLTLAMIYAGPSSQFPIYDGDMVRTGGRTSIVVNEGGRRLAMEHLFQRAATPKEIHVWIASVVGADRDLAERIGQSVDPR